jgi:hypothetical protein
MGPWEQWFKANIFLVKPEKNEEVLAFVYLKG